MSDQPTIDKGPAREADRHGSTGTEAAEYFHLLREERARDFERGYQLGRDLQHLNHQLEAINERLDNLDQAIQTLALAERNDFARILALLTPGPAVHLDVVAGPPVDQKV